MRLITIYLLSSDNKRKQMNPIISKYYYILFGKIYPPQTEAEVLAEIYDRNPLAYEQIIELIGLPQEFDKQGEFIDE